ncbi:hypothetical protein [Stenotrophomonas sp. 364]|uniref:hypothetical protein n=1 Tax=Stenotrophomonas sp. 364 TaxID=2691571 RepID=UPI001315C532|nr:hypothetical protein [Stenotrophomonas sp. 364]QHB72226.1 hypothetical protein GQ674_13430 [Stenotrophomonas sp. 364]
MKRKARAVPGLFVGAVLALVSIIAALRAASRPTVGSTPPCAMWWVPVGVGLDHCRIARDATLDGGQKKASHRCEASQNLAPEVGLEPTTP